MHTISNEQPNLPRPARDQAYLLGSTEDGIFDCDGLRLMLSLPEKPEFDHRSSILYFKVDNIQQATQTLTQRGVEFIDNLCSLPWELTISGWLSPRFGRQLSGADERGSTRDFDFLISNSCETAARGLVL